MLIDALTYLKWGWSVFPVPKGSKIPIIEWKEFQNRYATEKECRLWFGSGKNNIGLATGKLSSLCVVDYDGKKGAQTKNILQVTSPCCAKTGREEGGEHHYFGWPKVEVRNEQHREKGYDIRGEGGYIIAPPSLHESGQRYRWLKPYGGKLPVFPVEKFSLALPSTSLSFPTKPKDWVITALEAMQEGNRRITLLKVGGRLRFKGLTETEIITFLKPYADKSGLSKDLFNKIMRDVFKYPPQISSVSIYCHTYENSIQDYMNRPKGEFSMGFNKIDGLINGLNKTDIFVVAARTGVGKTNFFITVARNLCNLGFRVLYFCTEMAYSEVWERYGLEKVKEHKDHLIVNDLASLDLIKIKEQVQATQPDVLIVDHINFLGDDVDVLSRLIKGLKTVARDWNILTFAGAQLNRTADFINPETKEAEPPRLSQIKGAGAIEETADRALLLYEIGKSGILGANLDKNRHGRKGISYLSLEIKPYFELKEQG